MEKEFYVKMYVKNNTSKNRSRKILKICLTIIVLVLFCCFLSENYEYIMTMSIPALYLANLYRTMDDEDYLKEVNLTIHNDNAVKINVSNCEMHMDKLYSAEYIVKDKESLNLLYERDSNQLVISFIGSKRLYNEKDKLTTNTSNYRISVYIEPGNTIHIANIIGKEIKYI